ncbi:hypothetical protein EB796_015089 [Bugula neritina]|uniref:Uncharacterized protein n=1 Tax=Bugula neritina TaxID=10212 RepID=A0A7J7JL78_BUGNE|nr:hypothetical protein EB796_015089 [Bugula neritina]
MNGIDYPSGAMPGHPAPTPGTTGTPYTYTTGAQYAQPNPHISSSEEYLRAKAVHKSPYGNGVIMPAVAGQYMDPRNPHPSQYPHMMADSMAAEAALQQAALRANARHPRQAPQPYGYARSSYHLPPSAMNAQAAPMLTRQLSNPHPSMISPEQHHKLATAQHSQHTVQHSAGAMGHAVPSGYQSHQLPANQVSSGYAPSQRMRPMSPLTQGPPMTMVPHGTPSPMGPHVSAHHLPHHHHMARHQANGVSPAMAQTSMIPASHPQAHAMQRTPLADVLQQQQQHVLPQSTSSAHIQHPSQSIRSSSHMMPTQPMYRLPTYPHQKSMTQQQQAQQLHPQGHPQAHPRQSAMMSHHMTNSQSYPPTAAMPLPPMVHSRTPESRQHLDDLEAILPSM